MRGDKKGDSNDRPDIPDRMGDSNDHPDIPDRIELRSPDIPGLHSGEKGGGQLCVQRLQSPCSISFVNNCCIVSECK